MDMNEVEKKAYLSYHQDGLLDIGLGILVLSWAGAIMFDMGVLPAIMAASGVSVYFAAKQIVTVPRMGLVKFGQERQKRIRKEKRYFTLFFTATALLGMLFFLAWTMLPTEELMKIKDLPLVVIGLLGALLMATVAYWKQLRRFYIYAGVMAVSFIGGPFYDIGRAEYFLIPGVLILAGGIAQLIMFLRKYPIAKEKHNE
ncbi:MAG: hypothetical protein ABII71_04710 [Candidatus Micrarchaeota archaeon]